MFQLAQKADITQMIQIQNQYSRFALYDDLKKLHTMVIPEIAKFESNLLQSQKKIDQFVQVIRNFDEVIQTKSNKFKVEEELKLIKTNSINI